MRNFLLTFAFLAALFTTVNPTTQILPDCSGGNCPWVK